MSATYKDWDGHDQFPDNALLAATCVSGDPPPAGSEATEDGGQRYENDTSASELSDKYPAGLQRNVTEMRPHSRTARDTNRKRRSVSLDVRLTVTEREAIRHRARILGVKPSVWGRGVLLDALDQRGKRIVQLEQGAHRSAMPELAAAVEQLRRVGVNLNQVLRRGATVNEELLHQVRTNVDELRQLLGDRTQL